MISLWVYVFAASIGLPLIASIIWGDHKGFRLKYEDEKDVNLFPFNIRKDE